MLSVADLLEAGTLPLDLAAYLLAAIGSGACFMVGANPGGAGKTTVMGALLNFVPAGAELAPVPDIKTAQTGLAEPEPRRCFIAHEIRNARLYSYLWDEALRAYFRLPEAGHMLATNLHADTMEQARDQVCGENEVPAGHFARMNLALFLDVSGPVRKVSSVWEAAPGDHEHRQVYVKGRLDAGGLKLAARAERKKAEKTLEELAAAGLRDIRSVRSHLLQTYF